MTEKGVERGPLNVATSDQGGRLGTHDRVPWEPGKWPNVADVVHLCAECGRTTEARLGVARRMRAPLGHTARSAGRRAERGQFHFLRPLLILSRTTSSQMASFSDLNVFQPLEHGKSDPSGWGC
ncbi:hypothetical protein PanWU01x14_117710 [Parasponia andersonii]|uniref:Uncharacterized protein n=1 Tax=Parasponia andersonii TaxID=3476 RepID=A0A2P5CW27_PARAD|nr:hypothetical protein PanWU01x14_117710 [Parasponia andersonii]